MLRFFSLSTRGQEPSQLGSEWQCHRVVCVGCGKKKPKSGWRCYMNIVKLSIVGGVWLSFGQGGDE
jgi:hypothetical protein